MKALVEYARVEVHSAANRTFDVLSQIPSGISTGIHGLKNGRLFQTSGLQLMQPAVFNNDQSQNFAILGNGSDTEIRYGEQNRTARKNLEDILDQSFISDEQVPRESSGTCGTG